jgi:nucleoside phosphorylase
LGSQTPTLLSEMLRGQPKITGSRSSLHIATTKVTPVKTVTAKSVARDARPHPDSQIHHVTIGSANAVIKDATKRDKLKKDLWVLCAEMEAAGLMDESPCLVIQLFSGHAPSLRTPYI